MSRSPNFLSIEDVLFFHAEEMKLSGSKPEIRDINLLHSAINAPKATFGGNFLMDVFEMAATYVNSICFNHPFLDGNKRVAAVSALVFLDINGYIYHEKYHEELADTVLKLVTRKITKEELASNFKKRCKKKIGRR
jgi:death-on-curing protein